MINEIDRKILNILQQDARTSNAAIGREVGLSAAAIHARIKKLTAQGVIRRFTVQVDPVAVGYEILAFAQVFLSEMRRYEETLAALRALPEVVEVHSTIGESCFLLKVRCRCPNHLEDLLARVNDAPAVRATHTTLAVRTPVDHINPPLLPEAREAAE